MTAELVYEEAAGARLDHFLAAALPEFSRSRLQALVREGAVRVNGSPARISQKLRNGDRIRLVVPEPAAAVPAAQDLPLVVVYEDAALLVVDKAAGMVVHPGAGNPAGTLVNALLFHCRDLAGIGGVLRPGIVHRLDQDTSGLLVVAKDDHSHQQLAAQFKVHSIVREYQALVHGRPQAARGAFSSNIGRHPLNRKKMASVARGGKAAVTHYRLLRYYPEVDCAHLALNLETGRTHQIRVHLSEAGHPLVGDQVYGKKGLGRRGSGEHDFLARFPRQALHAG
ncbi:MAG: RluA family pseudouridine synthase, partial [Deltaproteobacteria bacterium]|nr:RluA family pseudouridine synthase [Deltaproteobacteria bacterium]